jgi:hypothetical protein
MSHFPIIFHNTAIPTALAARTNLTQKLMTLPFFILLYLALQKLYASSAFIVSTQIVNRGHIE